MTILDALDGLPGVRRVHAVVTGKTEPRNFRWSPLLILAALWTGYAFSSPGAAEHWRWALAGQALFWLAYMASSVMRLFGPRIVAGRGLPLDEREHTLRVRAGHISGTVVSTAAIASFFYFGVATLLHWWLPATILEWVLLGLATQGSYLVLPVLIASWLQTPSADD
jgi:hypothetical protein